MKSTATAGGLTTATVTNTDNSLQQARAAQRSAQTDALANILDNMDHRTDSNIDAVNNNQTTSTERYQQEKLANAEADAAFCRQHQLVDVIEGIAALLIKERPNRVQKSRNQNEPVSKDMQGDGSRTLTFVHHCMAELIRQQQAYNNQHSRNSSGNSPKAVSDTTPNKIQQQRHASTAAQRKRTTEQHKSSNNSVNNHSSSSHSSSNPASVASQVYQNDLTNKPVIGERFSTVAVPRPGPSCVAKKHDASNNLSESPSSGVVVLYAAPHRGSVDAVRLSLWLAAVPHRMAWVGWQRFKE